MDELVAPLISESTYYVFVFKTTLSIYKTTLRICTLQTVSLVPLFSISICLLMLFFFVKIYFFLYHIFWLVWYLFMKFNRDLAHVEAGGGTILRLNLFRKIFANFVYKRQILTPFHSDSKMCLLLRSLVFRTHFVFKSCLINLRQILLPNSANHQSCLFFSIFLFLVVIF